MSNPWLKKNPFMSMWLSGASSVANAARGRITAEMCRRLTNLQVVGRCGAGLDNIDTAAAQMAGIAVVHAPGRTTHAVSDHAVLLMLALASQAIYHFRHMLAADYPRLRPPLVAACAAPGAASAHIRLRANTRGASSTTTCRRPRAGAATSRRSTTC